MIKIRTFALAFCGSMTLAMPAFATCTYAGQDYSEGAVRGGQICTQDGTWDTHSIEAGGSIPINQRSIEPELLALELRKPEARICRSIQKFDDEYIYCQTGGYSGPPPVGFSCSCLVGFGSNERRIPGTVIDANDREDFD